MASFAPAEFQFTLALPVIKAATAVPTSSTPIKVSNTKGYPIFRELNFNAVLDKGLLCLDLSLASIFTDSALWAGSVIELPCPSVCLFVCLSICAIVPSSAVFWRGLLHIITSTPLELGT